MRPAIGLFRSSALIICLSAITARAEEDPSAWEKFRTRYSVRNSIQAGLEYDTNVYKTFDTSEDDFLARLRFQTRGRIPLSDTSALGWNYQAGGKKYFHEESQDTLLQYMEVPFTWRLSRFLGLNFRGEFKYENERGGAVDAGTTQTFIDKDYYSLAGTLSIPVALPAGTVFEPFGHYMFFRFAPEEDFRFHREQVGVSVRKRLGRGFAAGLHYTHGRQQFPSSGRRDSVNEGAVSLQYSRIPFASARYAFQDTGSNDRQFAYRNHRITILVSVPLGSRTEADSDPDERASSALFALHAMGVIHFSSFPSVYDFTEEGQRFLLTGAEDEIFNSALVKLSFHPSRSVALEAKYTRYSNQLSSQDRQFSRSLTYLGARFNF